jgi:Carboxypeptidase regulatory-like domain
MKRSVLVLTVLASLALLLSLTFGTATARAQFAKGLGTVEGTVLDAHGKPVADASVTIQTSDGLKPHATHTDSSGHYEFARYDAGQYDLRAYAKGQFSDWNKHVVIRPKKVTEITLRLPPEVTEKVTVTSNP